MTEASTLIENICDTEKDNTEDEPAVVKSSEKTNLVEFVSNQMINDHPVVLVFDASLLQNLSESQTRIHIKDFKIVEEREEKVEENIEEDSVIEESSRNGSFDSSVDNNLPLSNDTEITEKVEENIE